MGSSCNHTLEDMSLPDHQENLVGRFTFNELARLVGGAGTFVAVVVSLYLIFRHAFSYTKPREQRQIIRLIFMVPVYAVSCYMQICFYEKAIYIEAISSCYEAVALAAFFSLICHYVAPDLHSQKDFFRQMSPIKPWIGPVKWLSLCTGRERGPFRTPRSGLTWFNIIWVCVYQYCMIRTAMTVVSVVTQATGHYCESSNDPQFAHIWVTVIDLISLTVAMLNLIQIYAQLKEPLAEHKLLTKFIAFKLVVFLSLIQTSIISLATSHVDALKPSDTLATGDVKVGIPNLLLCIEMAALAIFHLFAFPHRPYHPGSKSTFYPPPDASTGGPYLENKHQSPSGGFLGFSAIFQALNLWDFFKAVGRGFRWVLCGVRKRKDDVSYKASLPTSDSRRGSSDGRTAEGHPLQHQQQELRDYDPPASPPPQYRRQNSQFPGYENMRGEEDAGLVHHAQPQPYDSHSARMTPSPPSSPPLQPFRFPEHGTEYRSG